MKSIAFIFARGGSKGLINKNLLDFDGIPLIAHTIKNAVASKLFEDIVISTDSEEIAEISRKYGGSVPFIRPSELATDESSEFLSWKHAIDEYDISTKCFVSLPCTSPLRNYEEIAKMIDLYKTGKYDVVVGITKSNHSPDFNMVYKNDNDSIEIIGNNKNLINRRQDTRKSYLITTYAYITSKNYIKKSQHLFDGQVGGYPISKIQSIDIDDIDDLNYALHLHASHKS